MLARKPDRLTAMHNIIEQVKLELPLYEDETFVCGTGTDCVGCPKNSSSWLIPSLATGSTISQMALRPTLMTLGALASCATT